MKDVREGDEVFFQNSKLSIKKTNIIKLSKILNWLRLGKWFKNKELGNISKGV